MPRKLDSETRVHFRAYEDEGHAQKRAFCLHCQQDACADNIQRMKNHLLKCESYLSNMGAEPYQHHMEGPIAPDNAMSGMGQQQQQQQQQQQHPQGGGGGVPQPGSMPDGSTPGPPAASHPQDPNASAMGPTTTTPAPPNNGSAPVPPMTPGAPGGPAPTSAAALKVAQASLDKVRQAIGRSSRRLESLEAVLKTQVQDGMPNAATHVRAAIRDERDRLFKLSQTLVKQEVKLRETQSGLGTF